MEFPMEDHSMKINNPGTFFATEVTVAISVRKVCVHRKMGYKSTSEPFFIETVRLQGSSETIVMDIFPS